MVLCRFHDLAEFDEAKEAAAGAWPDTMNGAGKATRKLPMKGPAMEKAIIILRKHSAGLLMRGEEFR
ncbi:hypothetical protein SESBI_00754 [Sesbania bispinosa]|nr:hypothetical protein SESBI_00754 [Sesbania bispinosa]